MSTSLAGKGPPGFKPLEQLIFYGIQSKKVGKEQLDIVSNQQKNVKNLQLIYLDENINKEGKQLSHIAMKKEDKHKAAVCIDLSCMNGTIAPGVSEVNKEVGFTQEQMKVNVEQALAADHDDLFIISEYNPAIEKFKTGNIVLELFQVILNCWISKVAK